MSEDITVAALKELCQKVIAKREEYDVIDETLKAIGKEVDALEMELLNAMKTHQMDSFKEGGKIFIMTKTPSITIPQGDDKEAFFSYLKEVGHFDGLITVNSRTLNSWYKKEDEAAKSRGEPYAMIPGLPLPTIREGLSVRKS